MGLTAGHEPPWSVAAAAAALAARTVSASELLDTVLTRLHATEPSVRAYSFVDEDGARAAAAQIDSQRTPSQPRSALHGIPVAVKDVIAVEGLPLEAGSAALRGRIADRDAHVVARLREAGAVIVGKTVTHELAYGQNTPPTRNARDAAREPGGSSAGSAVAVAVGSALAALGTDGGGSVRHPAALNGIAGFKPTYGTIDPAGVLTVAPSLDHVGVLARTARDCGLVLAALADVGPGPSRSLSGACIGVLGKLVENCGEDAKAAFASAAKLLERLGASLVDVDVPELDLAVPVGLGLTIPEAALAYGSLLRDRPELLEPGTRALLAAGELVPAVDYLVARRARRSVQAALRRAFESAGLDAVACPAAPEPAGPAESATPAMDRLAAALRIHMWANVTGVPALTVPCDDSRDGLPLGLQLACRPFADGRLLSLAVAFEDAACP
jgi:aspartyl-tRNA(Asn)/glutamyl-tRNA(Gln) amidotransferase subunit A